MCTLMKTSEMPSLNAKSGNNSKQFISLFLKPNREGENYRFRLLAYHGKDNDRKTAYFCQHVHNHWGTSANGKTKIVDDVIVCPSTKYVHYDEEKFVLNEKTGNKQLNCPICQKSAENFAIYKNSGNTDKIALKKAYALKSTFRAIIPVYVVNDPNTVDKDGKHINNGRLKVLIMTNKEEFERFDKMVEAEKAKAQIARKNGTPYEIANGDNGVDFCIHMESIEVVKNEGTSKEYRSTERKITNMGFMPTSMAYPIPNLTPDFIGTLDMDEQYYISNTKQELQDFYIKHYGCDEVVVPGENIDIFSTMKTEPATTNVPVSNTKPVEVKTEDVSENINLDDIGTDSDKTEETKPLELEEKVPDSNEVDSMWNDLGI